MKKINQDRGSIYCDDNIWGDLNSCVQELNPYKIFILVDTNTKEFCLPYFLSNFISNTQPTILEFHAGEGHKNIQTCLKLWEQLTEHGVDRNSLLINLGGGVVTDLGGFIACTIKRGIEFINIPTSLLAMVDASVGGKNGIDLNNIKNQIGVIKNPYSVFIDTSFLRTLPEKHMISGLAEMLKHGLIASEDYWKKIAQFDMERIDLISDLIWESIQIKNNIVSTDPFEKHKRKTLNYGHTLGHAIESFTLNESNRMQLLHGEAVAIGMILATYISSELMSFPKKKRDSITETILKFFKKQTFSQNDIKFILDYLIFDKKANNGNIHFVLLRDFGDCELNCEVSNELIYKAFDYYKYF